MAKFSVEVQLGSSVETTMRGLKQEIAECHAVGSFVETTMRGLKQTAGQRPADLRRLIRRDDDERIETLLTLLADVLADGSFVDETMVETRKPARPRLIRRRDDERIETS